LAGKAYILNGITACSQTHAKDDMAPLSFPILTFVLHFAAAKDLLFHKIPNWFACPEMIVGVVYRTHLKALSVSGMGMGWITHCPGSIPFHPVGFGMMHIDDKRYGGLKW
jgi:hypothetical protein